MVYNQGNVVHKINTILLDRETILIHKFRGKKWLETTDNHPLNPIQTKTRKIIEKIEQNRQKILIIKM